MKPLILVLFLIFLPLKEYVVVDIKENQLNYIILLKDIKTEKLFCIESIKSETISNIKKKINVGDIVSLKLRKSKSEKFKMSQNIDFFDDLNIYDDSLKVDKSYHCRELNGLYIVR